MDGCRAGGAGSDACVLRPWLARRTAGAAVADLQDGAPLGKASALLVVLGAAAGQQGWQAACRRASHARPALAAQRAAPQALRCFPVLVACAAQRSPLAQVVDALGLGLAVGAGQRHNALVHLERRTEEHRRHNLSARRARQPGMRGHPPRRGSQGESERVAGLRAGCRGWEARAAAGWSRRGGGGGGGGAQRFASAEGASPEGTAAGLGPPADAP